MHDGKIKLKNMNITLYPAMSKQEFLESPLADQASPLVHNEEYQSYRLGTHVVGNVERNISLCFVNDRLWMILLSPISDVPEAEFSEDSLRIQKGINDQWLEDQFGLKPISKFKWGIVESTCDLKTWVAEVVIRYEI